MGEEKKVGKGRGGKKKEREDRERERRKKGKRRGGGEENLYEKQQKLHLFLCSPDQPGSTAV